MKKGLSLALIGATAVLAAASSAQAEGGCGRGWHRAMTGSGRCYPDGPGPGAYGPPGPAIGVFYPGRGYWSSGRYYGHRAWGGRGWRYW